MIVQRLRKHGKTFVVTIPKDVVERQQFHVGMMLVIDVQPAEVRPTLSPEVRRAFEESWEHNQSGYRRLAAR